MYKVRIVFLYTDSEDKCTWSHQWADWGGVADDLDGIIAEYKEKEEKALKDSDMDQKVIYVIIVDSNDITDGKYQCGSCECYFDEPDDGDCPYCGSGNFVEGCIDEPEPTEPQEFSGPRLCKP